MSKQLGFFDSFEASERTATVRREPRRINYQETSREAFDSFQPDSSTLDGQILAALLEAGKAGLIDQEIEQRIGRSHQAVSGNRRHLVERQLVCETVLRGMTTSGRKAIRWVHRDCYDVSVHGAQ